METTQRQTQNATFVVNHTPTTALVYTVQLCTKSYETRAKKL